MPKDDGQKFFSLTGEQVWHYKMRLMKINFDSHRFKWLLTTCVSPLKKDRKIHPTNIRAHPLCFKDASAFQRIVQMQPMARQSQNKRRLTFIGLPVSSIGMFPTVENQKLKNFAIILSFILSKPMLPFQCHCVRILKGLSLKE